MAGITGNFAAASTMSACFAACSIYAGSSAAVTVYNCRTAAYMASLITCLIAGLTFYNSIPAALTADCTQSFTIRTYRLRRFRLRIVTCLVCLCFIVRYFVRFFTAICRFFFSPTLPMLSVLIIWVEIFTSML